MKSIFLKSLLAGTLTAGVAVSFSCSCSTGSMDDDKDGGQSYEGLLTEDMKSGLMAYFTDRLSGEDSALEEDVILSPDCLDDNAGIVWDVWKEANNSFSEEKLIDIVPLSEGKTGKFSLPAELEPSASMPYYLGTKGNRPADGWPLFVYMHGSGAKEAEWDAGLKLCRDFDDAPSLYFIPQIPNEGQWYRWWQKSKQYAWEKLLRLALVSGEVDPDRVYFFGISEGGYGSQRLASFYADYLAAAGPMAGGEPLKNAPAENCANIAFSLRTGSADGGFGRNILTGYTKEAFDGLEAQHPGYYVHNVEIIQGAGHNIDYYPTTPWLAQYSRNPWPKYVCWENFEMDGWYRDGFHNLQVLERSNGDTGLRTVYEMTIDGNTVNMSVDNVSYTTTETMNGIEMKFEKTGEPAGSGKFRIYLNSHLVDLSSEVTVNVNGKQAFKGVLQPKLEYMAESCALFYDPMRVFAYAVDVDLSEL